ncbi:uncharacterized protein LOC130692725 [Daphnia carinata]|uniref:uncharacterized protein LOC130692725 n=1 Tax=Daphnia carinata TaxID=120202 RepID=UPI00257B999D|nr:uncharacterized protein LOC130692725 [Daphnia carinata]
MEDGVRRKYEDAPGQVFEGKFGIRDVETKRVRVHRSLIRKEEEALLELIHPNIDKLHQRESDNDYLWGISYFLELRTVRYQQWFNFFFYRVTRYCEWDRYLATLDQLFLKSNDARKYKGCMPHHIDGLLQLANGLEYIHSKNLVHGDIKPENVLIVEGSAGQDEIILKWTNFGLIRSVNEARQNSPIRRNKAWLAPELLQLTRLIGNVDEISYPVSVRSDVFALGLVFGCLLLNGEHLYGPTANENEITDNIVNGNPINMQKMDGKLRDCYVNDLLKQMLRNDPNERITSKEVVAQLQSIKNTLSGKEKELLELCGRDSREDLTEKIKELVQFGINVNAKDKDGTNVLHLLCRNYSNPKFTDAIQLVIESGIDVNARDNYGMNAIHYLCRYHSSQTLINGIEVLNQSGIDAKAITDDGSNALHYLCRYNSTPNLVDAVGILTKFGVDMMLPDNAGWNAYYYSLNKVNKGMKIWFDREKPIGGGGFGMVFKGKFGGREVAVKRVEMRHVDKREKDAMLKLDHPNIVKLLHYETDNDFMYYALELCVASLDQLFLKSDHPKKYNGPMPPPIEIFRQLATGLAYIHSMNLIHRDIKPENILIMRKPGKIEEIIMKWSDFGLAKSVNEKGLHSWSGVKGTRTWYAPEVLEKLINEKKAENEEFWGTVKSDVFVLGLVFGYIFLDGEHLFGSSETDIHLNITRSDPVNMKNIDAELRKYYENDLLKKMLEHDSVKRISSKEVVKQLESIKNKLAEKEKEFRQLCARGSLSDLKRRANDFIRIGIDMNAKDNNGRNALHNLCKSSSSPHLIDAIQLLIPLGIDVNAKESIWQRNALHYLCESNSSPNLIGAIQLLIQLGIDVNAKDDDGCNALHILCESNSSPNLIEAIQLLIQLGIDVNAKDFLKRNALHYLCESNSSPNSIDAIQLLIPLGIDVNAKDIWGRNARSYLRDNGKIRSKDEILELLDAALVV